MISCSGSVAAVMSAIAPLASRALMHEPAIIEPAIALLILHRLVRQVISFTADIPATHGIAQATTPTTHSIHILREVEQVRADTADLAEVLEGQCLGFGVAVSCHQRQSKNGRIVLRRASAIADFNNAVHGANAI